MGCGLFRRSRARVDPTMPAVVADVVIRSVVNDGLVVDVVNVRDIYVIHGAVVIEASVSPISALIADTPIAEAVVDAAVKTDIRAPVAIVPGISVTTPTPIAGRPQQTNLGSHHPRTRHPEVTFLSIRPVAGRPQIAVSRGHRLRVQR
jgi:hypothetical protein